jgi:hypothetical protein
MPGAVGDGKMDTYSRDAPGWYVFAVLEAEVEEATGYGPVYTLVANRESTDGIWHADTALGAIKLAAQGRDDIYAACPAESLTVERWPLLS